MTSLADVSLIVVRFPVREHSRSDEFHMLFSCLLVKLKAKDFVVVLLKHDTLSIDTTSPPSYNAGLKVDDSMRRKLLALVAFRRFVALFFVEFFKVHSLSC